MNILKNGNWGLKLLALILAIVIYHALKNETVRTEPIGQRIRPHQNEQ